jgi:hypothetical protein
MFILWTRNMHAARAPVHSRQFGRAKAVNCVEHRAKP